ncbi:GDSL-type esterase/lipase family protein [Streptomyces albidoflavus]
MPMPAGIATVTLTGRYIRPDGTPLKGTVTFTTPALLTLSGADTISAGSATVSLDAEGMFSVLLVATDNANTQPVEWAYQVTERFQDVTGRTYSIMLPSTTPTVDIADIAPADPSQGSYILVPGPAGPAGTQVLTGSTAPSNALGANGDLYIATVPGDVKLYGPKAGGTWPATGVSLGGGGGNLITSVNGQTGAVTLTAADVGALTQSTADTRYARTTVTARSDLGIYVPPGWGQRWRAARAAAGTTPARIVTVGGSATQGFYASNPHTKSWPGVVRTALQAAHGDGGSGFMSSSMSATILQAGDPTALAAWQAAGAIVGQTGTWTQGGSKYGPGVCYLYSDVPGSSMTFTVRGSTVKIYTVAGGTRPPFTYSVDGATAVTVNQTTGSASIQTTTVSGLSSGTHTVTITVGPTATTGAYLSVCGVSGENAAGVVVHNLALAGARSETYGNNASTALNATWNGGVDFPADLVVFTAGPNDAAANTAGDVWAANVAKYLKAVRDTGAADGSTDVMILLPHLGTHDTTNFKYQDYAVRARVLAEVYGAACVDMWTLGRNSWRYWSDLGYWGTNAGTGASGSDSVHPSDAGFAFMADTILPLLTA